MPLSWHWACNLEKILSLKKEQIGSLRFQHGIMEEEEDPSRKARVLLMINEDDRGS